MAKNTTPIILGTVLFGVLAIGLTLYSLFGGRSAEGPQPGPAEVQPISAATQKVYIARRPIYPRTVITSDMLEESEIDSPPDNAITHLNDLVGRLANDTIQVGQIITSDLLIPGVGRVIPANIAIPPGLRGVAIWVDPHQTAAGLVDVGDRVDIVSAHELQVEKADSQIIVGTAEYVAGRTIAQDLEVLAVDRSISAARPANAPQNAEGEEGAPASPSAQPAQQAEDRTRVILAASPEVAQTLIAANARGALHITIRNPESSDQFAIAETHEYPSRVANVPQPRAEVSVTPDSGAGEERPAQNRRSRPGAPPSFEPPLPAPALPPTIPPYTPREQIPDPAPTPAMGKEVVVIRGSEKTLVTVPN